MKMNYKHTTVILGVSVIVLMVSFTAVLAGNINSSGLPMPPVHTRWRTFMPA